MKRVSFPLNRFSQKLWLYGFYVLLCQMVFILLFFLDDARTLSYTTLLHTYLPIWESPLMSFTLLIGGALLYDYIVLTETK